jgi:serine/threonine-protein kinase
VRLFAALVLLLVLPACDGSDGPGGGNGTGGTPPAGTAPPSGRYFPDGPWYQDVTNAPLDPRSPEVVAWLDGQGWGTGTMRIDFSIEVLEGDETTPLRPFNPTEDFFEPDCDLAEVPVPAGGALEGEAGYECFGDGDCHLIVVHRPSFRLFEMWRADIRGDAFDGGCLAIWDMTRVYGSRGRGEQCTSADAAGFPIAPLLFTADEVAAGSIDHAIRFIVPNSHIRADEYVHPATHGTFATSGSPSAPPYGTRLRLRADFPLESLPGEGARVVARAMQTYGMFLADAGQIALTAQSDRFTAARWTGLLDTRDLAAIRPRDFAMIEAGGRIPLTLDCVREP